MIVGGLRLWTGDGGEKERERGSENSPAVEERPSRGG